MVQDSLPVGNDWQATLNDNPEDWLFTPSMRELLEKEGPGAAAAAAIAAAGGAAGEGPAPAADRKPATEDCKIEEVSRFKPRLKLTPLHHT